MDSIAKIANRESISIDLSPYSYFICGQTSPNSLKQGTCFFVRYNGKLYLITSLHNFDGWESIKKTLERPYPDVYFLRLPTKEGWHFELVEIDIRKYKAAVSQYNFYEKADMCVHEISVSDKFAVLSIEEFVFNNLPLSKEISKLLAFGFPVDEDNSDPDTYVNNILVQAATLKPLGDITLPVHWQPVDKIDPFNYQVTVESGKFGAGNSGSPVYFASKDSSGKKAIGFAGVWSYGDLEKKSGWIVRPEYIREEIIRFSNESR